ncbi:aminopeptidase N [Salinarimonas chemoclinalis]|uniref:aminopeptidase N n=1 Tax=Salinarimonas chemoclinalis TaxID=3241599 RepID=UPI0035592BED
MKDSVPQAVRLSEYTCPPFLVDHVALRFELDATRTRVRADLTLRRNPESREDGPLVLDGEGLALVSLSLDGSVLAPDAYTVQPGALVLHAPPARRFTLGIETRLDPSANQALMGLYLSDGVFCTQCEAEGFRRITYFPDRPDVLATYTTTIVADAATAPVLLSNGDRVSCETLPDGRRRAVWHDPHPKPCYLFALVAGPLASRQKSVTTRSGRTVMLGAYALPERIDRCAYALDALERALRWDEAVYGRECDLDVFNIVALSDFNMGAMENKGLNVFNESFILADPETATDEDYANIESVVAHEYFHNWTGNRITCRDWFQLCLKEGLTVFRDQEFTAQSRSGAVKRIGDVKRLRELQFSEDASALSHPVRPEAYHEISNFYTATVYFKGAEVVRMLRALVGAAAFARGMDLYFARCDGRAVTVEDFLGCFLDPESPRFAQFMLWYRRRGTPEIEASGTYDREARSYVLTLRQRMGDGAAASGETDAMIVPVATALIGGAGEMAVGLDGAPFDGLLVLDRAEASFRFTDVPEAPIVSLNRDFSAPVKVAVARTDAELAALAARETDGFARWDALHALKTAALVAGARGGEGAAPGIAGTPLNGLAFALEALLADEAVDPAFTALALEIPGEAEIAQAIGGDVDPDRILASRRALRRGLAARLGAPLLAARERWASDEPYAPDPAQTGRRSLRNALLDLACAGEGGPEPARARELAWEHLVRADNMTDRAAALRMLVLECPERRAEALARFETLHGDDPLVMDKWLAVQATIPEAETVAWIRAAFASARLASRSPNRVHALVGTFTVQNPSQFHRLDGAGHALVAELVAELDGRNPMLASRLLAGFASWGRLEPGRRARARAALCALSQRADLSAQTAETLGHLLPESVRDRDP